MARLSRDSDRAYIQAIFDRIAKLEIKVVELTDAFEYHAGTSVEIILAERKLIKLKIAEQKKLVEETGNATEVVPPDMRHYQEPTQTTDARPGASQPGQ
jgi:hypothetical protein